MKVSVICLLLFALELGSAAPWLQSSRLPSKPRRVIPTPTFPIYTGTPCTLLGGEPQNDKLPWIRCFLSLLLSWAVHCLTWVLLWVKMLWRTLYVTHTHSFKSMMHFTVCTHACPWTVCIVSIIRRNWDSFFKFGIAWLAFLELYSCIFWGDQSIVVSPDEFSVASVVMESCWVFSCRQLDSKETYLAEVLTGWGCSVKTSAW